jgi:hypothetical protein
VVAQQAVHLPAGFLGLPVQLHHEVDHADAVRPAIDEVAEEPQSCLATGPIRILVDQACSTQRALELGAVPVHVPDHVGPLLIPHEGDDTSMASRMAARYAQ